jgi:hypothetical protein
MTRTQPIDEPLNLELAVDGYMWLRLSEYPAQETRIGSNEDTRQFLNARDDSKH